MSNEIENNVILDLKNVFLKNKVTFEKKDMYDGSDNYQNTTLIPIYDNEFKLFMDMSEILSKAIGYKVIVEPY